MMLPHCNDYIEQGNNMDRKGGREAKTGTIGTLNAFLALWYKYHQVYHRDPKYITAQKSSL